MSSSTADRSGTRRSDKSRSAKKRSDRKSSAKAHSTARTFAAAVLTVSDSCSRGERLDISGPAVAEVLSNYGFQVLATQTVSDDSTQIREALIHLARNTRFIVTTGGTGIAPRDVTPEATKALCDRLINGVAERMRFEGAKKTPFAVLSRGVCGIHRTSVILNLPGSPNGAVESLQAVIELIPHALELLDGKTEHS
jgi:molybdopterin adenylyltransferase